MKRSLYWAAGALIAGMTIAGAASAGSAPSTGGNELTQELSARCRVVYSHHWRHGHRYTTRRTVCTRPRCRTVVRYRWHHGHRVVVRTRVC